MSEVLKSKPRIFLLCRKAVKTILKLIFLFIITFFCPFGLLYLCFTLYHILREKTVLGKNVNSLAGNSIKTTHFSAFRLDKPKKDVL